MIVALGQAFSMLLHGGLFLVFAIGTRCQIASLR